MVTGFEPVRLQELLNIEYGANRYSLKKVKDKVYVEIPLSTSISDFLFLAAFNDERIIPEKVKSKKQKRKESESNEPQTKALNDEGYTTITGSIKINKKKVELVENELVTYNPIREPPQNTLATLRANYRLADSFVRIGNKKPVKLKRIVYLTQRDTILVKKMKKIYDNTCQICGEKVQIGEKRFASEVHHIRPLGKHSGSDTSDNVIVLCPNHHLMFDRGAIKVDITNKKVYHIDSNHPIHEQDLTLTHKINEKNIVYHNEYIFGMSK